MSKPNLPNTAWLSHILGHCMCSDTDETCWFNRTWQSLDDGTKDSEYEDIKRAIEPLQEAAIQAKFTEQAAHPSTSRGYQLGYAAGVTEQQQRHLEEVQAARFDENSTIHRWLQKPKDYDSMTTVEQYQWVAMMVGKIGSWLDSRQAELKQLGDGGGKG